jgi:hypothetical protein
VLTYNQVWQIIAGFSNLFKVWDQKYVFQDSKQEYKQPCLNRLAENPDNEIITELKNLDSYLGMFSNCKGFEKLLPKLKAHNIEYFSSTVAEVKSDAWIASYNTLTEIRPILPNCEMEADFKLVIAETDIYGEVWEPRELPSSWIDNSPFPVAVTDHRTEQPKRMRILHKKGKTQLPSDIIGIWVAHVYHTILTRSWIDFFTNDMAKRPNVLGVAFWVRSGSKRFSSPCIRCQGLTNEQHDIYWLDNMACKWMYLQRKFLCSVID